eukprot:PITA_35272
MARIKRSRCLTLQFHSVLIMGVALISVMVLDAQSCHGLSLDFYNTSCPEAEEIIKSVVKDAVDKEARMAASLLRLHFHDCFVKGCDASVLLDDTANFTGEKTAKPNQNSLRGFEVVDEIKAELEKACPGVVSCADILAVAARDSVVITGGPSWEVQLGRRDSRSASLQGANDNLPAPNSTHQTLETKFKLQGLDVVDMVTLSGAHTIGLARCSSFKPRLYNQTGINPATAINGAYLQQLQNICPQFGTDNNQTTSLDPVTPIKFDVNYYENLVAGMGLLTSDQVLYSTKGSLTPTLVQSYTTNPNAFFKQFAASMIKMGNISPLNGSSGEIRLNCRKMN